MPSSSSIADGPRRRKNRLGPILIVLAVLAMAIPAGVFSWQRRIERETAKTAQLIPAGAPCPTITKSAYEAGVVKATQAFAREDVVFARAFGHVSCDYVANDNGRSLGDMPVCAFTSPSVLKITTPKGEFYFFPSSGPATVWVPHGVPKCVMASFFKG